jgi:hypothetical protein
MGNNAQKQPVAKKKTAVKAKSADLKTKPTKVSVGGFIASVPNEQRRKDAQTALKLMKKVTGLEPKMWGPSIVGFGSYHYKYESGREGDMCLTGFSPRASALVFYVMGGAPETDPLFKKLGKYKSGKACLYVNKLDDVDLGVLEKIIAKSVAYMRKKYPTSK